MNYYVIATEAAVKDSGFVLWAGGPECGQNQYFAEGLSEAEAEALRLRPGVVVVNQTDEMPDSFR